MIAIDGLGALRLGVLAGALLGLGCAGVLTADGPGDEGVSAVAGKTPVAVRLSRDMLAGVGLKEYGPLPSSMLLEGGRGHRGHIFFMGEEIVVEVWDADPATIAISDPYPYDEFVTILSGKLVLTDAQGTKTHYAAGDSLVVPKGFTGTWEMQGKFRELVVIERDAYVTEDANP